MRTKKFREYNLDQQFLFPPDIRDWVPEDDFARFISDLVDTLDLKGFEEYHKPGAGQPPYDPAMMLKVVLYCFCTGIFSSRKMERATYRDVGVRFLAANQQPDYTSFSNFRKRHSAAIQDTFAQVVALCRTMGLVSLGSVAIDGTIVPANASKTKNVLVSELDELISTGQALYNALEERWKQMDAEERTAHEEIPKELKKADLRIKSLEKAKEAVDKLKAEANEQTASEVAPPCNSAQIVETADAPDGDDEVVQEPGQMEFEEALVKLGWSQSALCKETGISPPRISRLKTGGCRPTAEETEKIYRALGVTSLRFKYKKPRKSGCREKTRPEKTRERKYVNTTDTDSYPIARPDKGCRQAFNAQAAADSTSQIFIATRVSSDPHDGKNLLPMLEELERMGLLQDIKEILADCGYFSRKAVFSSLAAHLNMCVPPERKKRKAINPDPQVQRMRDKMSTDAGRAARRLRSAVIEPPFGHIKLGLGFTRFLCRGLVGVTTEWTLVTLAHNAKKMFRRWK